MTEKDQADVVLSRKAVFVRYCLKAFLIAVASGKSPHLVIIPRLCAPALSISRRRECKYSDPTAQRPPYCYGKCGTDLTTPGKHKRRTTLTLILSV